MTIGWQFVCQDTSYTRTSSSGVAIGDPIEPRTPTPILLLPSLHPSLTVAPQDFRRGAREGRSPGLSPRHFLKFASRRPPLARAHSTTACQRLSARTSLDPVVRAFNVATSWPPMSRGWQPSSRVAPVKCAAAKKFPLRPPQPAQPPVLWRRARELHLQMSSWGYGRTSSIGPTAQLIQGWGHGAAEPCSSSSLRLKQPPAAAAAGARRVFSQFLVSSASSYGTHGSYGTVSGPWTSHSTDQRASTTLELTFNHEESQLVQQARFQFQAPRIHDYPYELRAHDRNTFARKTVSSFTCSEYCLQFTKPRFRRPMDQPVQLPAYLFALLAAICRAILMGPTADASETAHRMDNGSPWSHTANGSCSVDRYFINPLISWVQNSKERSHLDVSPLCLGTDQINQATLTSYGLQTIRSEIAPVPVYLQLSGRVLCSNASCPGLSSGRGASIADVASANPATCHVPPREVMSESHMLPSSHVWAPATLKPVVLYEEQV
ncbi:hypothetical protein CC86DRAFT_385041 [Ophiobolus disseminans]|uniref:Uncharacterized protein n=1 Tax=Ophiobolus disseminans TaxID=1469910 RepID=A0A6A6ZPV3_9PLEO|nr:hypothetical protein CC86DRAFT_385041 [Ophiobolus disseminans]